MGPLELSDNQIDSPRSTDIAKANEKAIIFPATLFEIHRTTNLQTLLGTPNCGGC